MNDYYLDSSAIVKRYAIEAGTNWVVTITDAGSDNSILLSEITLAEVAAALSAKQRAPDGISIEDRDHALSLFLQECRDRYLLLAVDRETLDLAVDLCLRHPLRGYDAVQLATALLASNDLVAAGRSPLTFVSAEDDLLNAAQKEGLEIENPNLYS